MTDAYQHGQTPPPSPDESYWAALLDEGENANPAFDQREGSPSDDENVIIGLETDYFQTVPHDAFGNDWEDIAEITERDEVVRLSVVGYNRGGLLVEWRTLRGFVPASQLINFPATGNSALRRQALLDHVDRTLDLRVIELSAEKNRLILSERAAQAEAGRRANILNELKTGDIVTGIITNLCEFGAFVDLGGLEGLIHISELSWGRVGHPNNILRREQRVDAYVLDVDQDAGRVALSLKRMRPDPWQTVEERYYIGQIIEGIVTNVVDFGAFACVEEGLEGLIHVSELAEGNFLHPRNVVTEGETIQARILTIDGPSRRLGLSLRLAHASVE